METKRTYHHPDGTAAVVAPVNTGWQVTIVNAHRDGILGNIKVFNSYGAAASYARDYAEDQWSN